MFQDRCYDRDNDMTTQFVGNNNTVDIDMNVDSNFGDMPMMGMNSAMAQNPIVGPVQERVVNRTFVHEVPHVCPIHTKIINHHIYRHTYRPCYTCSEENVCSNMQCGSCCQFR